MRYLPLSEADRAEMLDVIGVGSIDDLFIDVPVEARLDGPIRDLPMHASELSVERQLGAMAAKNMVAGQVPFFLGCGAYKHHVPASVDHIIQRGEFLTAYTPYQPEIAQGTLQVLFEFQTQVARLLGCEVANASMYDGSTACWEAIGMARRITRRTGAILSSGLHPHYVSVAKTMARFMRSLIETDGDPLLVPVPLHSSRLWTRGFNQAALLAGELARLCDIEHDPFVLQRGKRTAALKGMSPQQRKREVAGAFKVEKGSRLSGRRVILVDDVLTTGSTANGCAKALLGAGADRVDLICWARVVRPAQLVL